MSMGGLARSCQVLPLAKAAEAADRPPAIAWRPVLAQTDDEHHDLLFDQEAGNRRPMTFDPSIREFLTAARLGVVCPIRPDGRPRQSVTYYIFDGDRVLISTESKRGEAREVIRDGWASICVMGQEAPYPSVTVEGPRASAPPASARQPPASSPPSPATRPHRWAMRTSPASTGLSSKSRAPESRERPISPAAE